MEKKERKTTGNVDNGQKANTKLKSSVTVDKTPQKKSPIKSDNATKPTKSSKPVPFSHQFDKLDFKKAEELLKSIKDAYSDL
jgi:hypothetical protein